MSACIYCRIVKGEIPCMKVFENERVLAFLDIAPLSRGHAVVLPKFHGSKLTDIPDADLAELLPVAKKIAMALGVTDFNILQNNGTIAHQEVHHVNVHMIPKPNETEGLHMSWQDKVGDMDRLRQLSDEIKSKILK